MWAMNLTTQASLLHSYILSDYRGFIFNGPNIMVKLKNFFYQGSVAWQGEFKDY